MTVNFALSEIDWSLLYNNNCFVGTLGFFESWKNRYPRYTQGCVNEISNCFFRNLKQDKEHTNTIEALEKERDFYFGKLREIEVICQEVDNNVEADDYAKTTCSKITEILYATEVTFVFRFRLPKNYTFILTKTSLGWNVDLKTHCYYTLRNIFMRIITVRTYFLCFTITFNY